jgi:hypothetical protein
MDLQPTPLLTEPSPHYGAVRFLACVTAVIVVAMLALALVS